MKKILILTYYYPPCNSIAANRPKSFADYFSKKNDVKVITRNWTGKEKIWNEYIDSNETPKTYIRTSETLEEIYLPYKRINPSKFSLIKGLISGQLHQEIDTTQFSYEAKKLVQEWKPDVIIATSPPLNILKLAKQLSKIKESKFVADFRDFENEHILTDTNKKSLKSKVFHISNKFHTLRLLKKANLIATSSPAITNFFKIRNLPTITVTNGYEASTFNKLSKNETSSEKFTLSLIGTLYDSQEIELILYLLKDFKHDKSDVEINFVGTAENTSAKAKIDSILGFKNVNISHKIDRELALLKMSESHILFYMGWQGYKGVYSGKIFEYLGAKRNILIVPSDNDVIESLIKETKSGFVSSDPHEVINKLNSQYEEWKLTGKLNYFGNDISISKYSRENQAEIFLNSILNL